MHRISCLDWHEMPKPGGLSRMRKYGRGCKLILMVIGFPLAFSLFLASTGCAGGSLSSPPTSTAPSSPTPGQLAANPSNITFGDVTLNTAATRTVQLSNPGGASITISSASIGGPGFQGTGLSVPMTLSPGQTARFSVSFDPSSPGPATGSVQITGANGISPLTIALTGTGVDSAPGSHVVDLNWRPSASSVLGYNVYRSSQSGGPYTQTNPALVAGTSFTDPSVTAGQTYFYVVTAVASGGESVHSNEATATVPTP
jgi:hypothetical protein